MRFGRGGAVVQLQRALDRLKAFGVDLPDHARRTATVREHGVGGKLGVGQLGRDPRSLKQRLAIAAVARQPLRPAEPDQRPAALRALLLA